MLANMGLASFDVSVGVGHSVALEVGIRNNAAVMMVAGPGHHCMPLKLIRFRCLRGVEEQVL